MAITDVGDFFPVGVAVEGQTLWVATVAERAVRIEVGTNARTVEVPIGYPVAMTAGEGAVWVSGRAQIWRIDPQIGVVTQTISVGQRLMGLCAVDGAVWVADNGAGTVIRIDPVGGQAVRSVTVGHAPTDVASSDGTIWVAIQRERVM